MPAKKTAVKKASKKTAKKKVERTPRVKKTKVVRTPKPEIPVINPKAKPDTTDLQKKVIDEVRRKLAKEQIYTVNVDSLPTDEQIAEMGYDVAVTQLYYTSQYWEGVLR